MAIIPRKGVPSNVPLAFALGGTNGLVATLLELEVCPPTPLSEAQLRAEAAAAAAATAKPF